MVVVVGRNRIAGDAGACKAVADGGQESDGVERRMHGERDEPGFKNVGDTSAFSLRPLHDRRDALALSECADGLEPRGDLVIFKGAEHINLGQKFGSHLLLQPLWVLFATHFYPLLMPTRRYDSRQITSFPRSFGVDNQVDCGWTTVRSVRFFVTPAKLLNLDV